MKGDPHDGFTLRGRCTGLFRIDVAFVETLPKNRRQYMNAVYWIGAVISFLLLAYLLAALLYPEKFS